MTRKTSLILSSIAALGLTAAFGAAQAQSPATPDDGGGTILTHLADDGGGTILTHVRLADDGGGTILTHVRLADDGGGTILTH